MRNVHGDLPIHAAAMKSESLDVIYILVSAYREGISSTSYSGELPLHLAAYNPNPYMIDCIISMYHDGISTKDNQGYLPIHFAAIHNTNVEVVKVLHSAYPEGMSTRTEQGDLPIHLAVAKSQSVEVIDILLSTYPEGVSMQNNQGDLPLHLECKSLCRPSIISKCIELYPDTLTIATEAGDIPWTLALREINAKNVNKRLQSLFLLLSARPASFSHPPLNPLVNQLPNLQDPMCRRLIFNLLPTCLTTEAHMQAYHDLNWRPRSPLLQLFQQIRRKSREIRAAATCTSLEQLLSTTDPSHTLSTNDQRMRQLILKMLQRSPLVNADAAESLGYGLEIENGIGDLLLRFVVEYL
jgi:hypothetical protein